MIRYIFRLIRDQLQQLRRSDKQKPAATQPAPKAEVQSKPPQQGQQAQANHQGKSQRHKRPEPPHKPKWTLDQFPVEPEEGKTRFHDLLPADPDSERRGGLPLGLMHAIADLEFQYCSPIQAEVLPHSLTGRDVTGQGQTGTGKTAAFLITMLNRFMRRGISGKRPSGTPRGLILAPTRELVIQIAKDARALSRYSRVRIGEAFGGMDYQKQQNYLQSKPVDILVATPGRLLDFQRNKVVDLRQVEILVLDEADRMLDMGFIPDVKQIVHSTPHKDKRQTLFFSATFTTEVRWLAEQWTRNPEHIVIEPESVAADTVEQLVYITTTEEKFTLLYNLITQQDLQRVMIFTNQRHETRKLTDRLYRYGISCAMLSGEVAQNKRVKTLENFRAGRIRVMVATDVAGRGIHIDGVSHVINYTLPQDPEDYVHRIGRTGRAGESGTSVSFACEEDAFQIPDIQEYLGKELPCVQPPENLLEKLPPPPERKPRPEGKDGEGERSERPRREGSGERSGDQQHRPRRRRGGRNRRGGGQGRNRSQGQGQQSAGQEQHSTPNNSE